MDPASYFTIQNLLFSGFILLLIILGALLLLFSPLLIILFLRILRRKQKVKNLVFLEVRLPRENEIEISAAGQMFSSLYSIQKTGIGGILQGQENLSFEIVARPNQISFYVVVPRDLATLVEKQIHGNYSEASISLVKPWNIWKSGGFVSFGSLRLKGPNYFPIRCHEDLPMDPLNTLTSAMSKLSEGEAAAIQVMIQPAGADWQVAGKQFIDRLKAKSVNQEKLKIPVDEEYLQAISRKCSKSGFLVSIRLVAVAQDKPSANMHLQNLIGAFGQFNDPTFNGFKKDITFSRRLFMKSFIYRFFPVFNLTFLHLPVYTGVSILNTEELATLIHFPNKNVTTPHIDWLRARTSAVPSELPGTGLYLGKSIFRGVEKEVHILKDDRRRHMYIIGQTGTGKSEFLKFMAVQDIKNGEGVAFIDPHGSALEEILEQIPKERLEDVIYFDVGDNERPMGLNILEASSEEEQHLIINAFIALLYKLYDPERRGIMGPRLERAVRNVMLTAMSEKGNTLVEVLRLLTDPTFARAKIHLIKDPLVKKYWTDELARTSQFHKSEVLGYFVSKFDRFVTEKIMRNIIGQSTSSFNFRQVMDEGKVLLVDLSKGKIGEENSNFLGLVLVPRILTAAMRRIDQPEEKRRDFYLYVDEFQNFSTPDFAQILSEARKYRLSLAVANQFIGQMQLEIRDAVFGNVGTLVAFRVGVDDAEYLEHHFEPVFTKNDLINNPVGHTYLRLLVSGAPTIPFSMATDWTEMQRAPRDEKTARLIKQYSRLKYGRDKILVEAEIAQRAQF